MSAITNVCPCCNGLILRHVRSNGIYWFCQSCRQEVPLISINQSPRVNSNQADNWVKRSILPKIPRFLCVQR